MAKLSAFAQTLRSRDFLKLWIGQIVSGLGDRLEQMGIVALFTAAGYTSVTATMALIAVLVILPHMFLSLPAGWVVDRYDRRHVMIATDVLRALVVITLPWTFPRYGETAVYVSVALLGVFTTFFNPAKSALIPRLVPHEALPAANGLSSTTNIVATMLGAFIGGHLARALGVDRGASAVPFFLIDMASYLVSAGFLWRIATSGRPQARAQPASAPTPTVRLWPFLRAEPTARGLLFVAAVFWAVAAVAYSAINSFAYTRFQGGVAAVGNMQAALGLGMLLGAVIAGTRPVVLTRYRRDMALSLVLAAAVLIAFAASPTMTFALIMVALLGATAAAVLVTIDTGLQHLSADALRGRVFGFKEQLTSATFILPSLWFAFVPGVDPYIPWALGAAAAMLIVVGLAFAARHLSAQWRAHEGTDWGRPWLNRLDGINRWWCKRFHRLQGEPLPLPPSGPVLVVANHVSGVDPLLMIAASNRPLRFIIAREQYERWYLRGLFRAIGCIPIGRRGGHRDALAAARAALAAGEAVALFPSGGITRRSEEVVALKPGVAILAEQSGAPVIPVRIDGVGGHGFTVAAVFIPSRARLKAHPPMNCLTGVRAAFLDTLKRRIFSP